MLNWGEFCWYEVTGSDHHDTKVKKSEIKFKLSMKTNLLNYEPFLVDWNLIYDVDGFI